MADNVEVKIEQLTDAIRSLYSRPALSQSEIANMMTSLAQKFENSSDNGTQKLINIIVNETKKVLEEKHHEMRTQLYDFENLLKQMTQTLSNPKMSMEVTKILNEVSDMYAKLNNQEVALQKINQTLITAKSTNPVNEIIKLSNDFNTFSRGFENITHTLNKNFADFLNQVKSLDSREELGRLQLELDTINGNVNSVISALAIIDHKYQDLTGLIDAFRQKETLFGESLNEIKQITDKFDRIQEDISKTTSKEDLAEVKERISFLSDTINTITGNMDEALNQSAAKVSGAINSIESKLTKNVTLDDINSLKAELKNLTDKLSAQINTDKDEFIRKIQEHLTQLKSQSDNDIRQQIFEHSNGITEGINFISSQMSKLQEGIDTSIANKTQRVNDDINNIKEKLDWVGQNIEKLPKENILNEIKLLEEEVKAVTKDSLSSIVGLINNEFANLDNALENKTIRNRENINSAVNTLREDLKTFMQSFSSLKDEVSAVNHGNIKILQEPIERALKELREVTIGDQLNAINQNVKDTTASISVSFEQIKQSFERVASGSNIEVLSQLRDTIPQISDKLEIFRNHVVSENSANLTELKSSFYEVAETIKAYLEDTNFKVQEEIQNSYAESLGEVRLDLQTLSNHLIESVENVNSNISKEFEAHKSNIDALLNKIDNYDETLGVKISNIEANMENASVESLSKLNDALGSSTAMIQDSVNEIKNDLIEGILGSTKSTKANFGVIEEKINMLLALGQKTDDDTNTAIYETLTNILEKIELLNLTYGQNDKENNNEEVFRAVNSILEKVEHTNLQQIHNAKELLEEIQNNGSEIIKKINELKESEEKTEDYNNTSTDLELALKIDAINEKLSVLNVDNDEEIKESVELLKEHVETLTKELGEQIIDKIDEINDKHDEFEDNSKPEIEEYLSKIDEYLTNVEYLKNNLGEDLRECIEAQVMDLQDKFEAALSSKNDEAKVDTFNLIQRVSNVESNIEKITTGITKIATSGDDTSYSYSLQDVESDIAKLRLSIEKNMKGDNYKEFINRLIELKNINIETNKLNHTLEAQMAHLNSWFKNANQRLEALSAQVENAERMSMEEIKTRLIHSEKSPGSGKIEEISKKQISYLEDLDEKMNLIIQKQNNDFDPASFIDVTYENMKQTKNLTVRMDNLEDKIDKIQGYMEKIIAYIEE